MLQIFERISIFSEFNLDKNSSASWECEGCVTEDAFWFLITLSKVEPLARKSLSIDRYSLWLAFLPGIMTLSTV